MGDEEIVGFTSKRIIIDQRPILIGSIELPGGLHTAPYFYYLVALIMVLTKFEPIWEGIVASIIGVLTIWLVFYVGKQLFNQKIALLACLFYSLSFLVSIYNRYLSLLTFMPVASLLTYLCLYKIIAKKNYFWVYPLSFSLLLSVQGEGSGFSLPILTIILWLLLKLKLSQKVLRAVGIFIFFHFPLLFFEIRHQFYLTKNLLRLLTPSDSKGINFAAPLNSIIMIPKTLARMFFLSGPNDVVKQIFPCEGYVIQRQMVNPFLIVLAILVIFYCFIQAFKNKKVGGLKIISWHLIVIAAGVFIFNLLIPGHSHEWFFNVFFPGFALLSGYFFISLSKKNILKLITIGFVLFFVFRNINDTFTANNIFGYSKKKQAVELALSEVKSQKFYLDSTGECFGYGGYRYLFWVFGNEPTHSPLMESWGGWLFEKPNQEKPDLGVVMVNYSPFEPKQFYQTLEEYFKKTTNRKSFGELEVLIVRDKNY